MAASSTADPAVNSHDRRGMGAVVAFVLWIIALSFIYALSQSQAQSTALTGVVRVAGLRLVEWAARSSLNEVAFKLTLPPQSGVDTMRQLQLGQTPPPVAPAGTREIYAEHIARGELSISPVEVKLFGGTKPPDSREVWFFDASVKVEYQLGSSKLVKTLRRRLTGRQFMFRVTLGPDENIPPVLALDPGFLFEVME